VPAIEPALRAIERGGTTIEIQRRTDRGHGADARVLDMGGEAQGDVPAERVAEDDHARESRQ
jgi:hypothetical protein